MFLGEFSNRFLSQLDSLLASNGSVIKAKELKGAFNQPLGHWPLAKDGNAFIVLLARVDIVAKPCQLGRPPQQPESHVVSAAIDGHIRVSLGMELKDAEALVMAIFLTGMAQSAIVVIITKGGQTHSVLVCPTPTF